MKIKLKNLKKIGDRTYPHRVIIPRDRCGFTPERYAFYLARAVWPEHFSPSATFPETSELFGWCLENHGNPMKRLERIYRQPHSVHFDDTAKWAYLSPVAFAFKDVKDAIMFKMMWV